MIRSSSIARGSKIPRAYLLQKRFLFFLGVAAIFFELYNTVIIEVVTDPSIIVKSKSSLDILFQDKIKTDFPNPRRHKCINEAQSLLPDTVEQLNRTIEILQTYVHYSNFVF